ncbi:MAG TPA: hypothetical protein VLM11_18545 [Streptosporangiaceae bacterium]|nr:hypothetical protein [Streptosporangiaceae bacterium]
MRSAGFWGLASSLYWWGRFYVITRWTTGAPPRSQPQRDPRGDRPVICLHPECTGVHDNNRFSELCPRSRALKRIKDQRYLGTKGVSVHRMVLAFRRGCVEKYSGGSYYGVDFDPAEMAGHIAKFADGHAVEIERFRAQREGNRGTRRKPDVICGAVISVAQILAFSSDMSTMSSDASVVLSNLRPRCVHGFPFHLGLAMGYLVTANIKFQNGDINGATADVQMANSLVNQSTAIVQKWTKASGA